MLETFGRYESLDVFCSLVHSSQLSPLTTTLAAERQTLTFTNVVLVFVGKTNAISVSSVFVSKARNNSYCVDTRALGFLGADVSGGVHHTERLAVLVGFHRDTGLCVPGVHVSGSVHHTERPTVLVGFHRDAGLRVSGAHVSGGVHHTGRPTVLVGFHRDAGLCVPGVHVSTGVHHTERPTVLVGFHRDAGLCVPGVHVSGGVVPSDGQRHGFRLHLGRRRHRPLLGRSIFTEFFTEFTETTTVLKIVMV